MLYKHISDYELLFQIYCHGPLQSWMLTSCAIFSVLSLQGVLFLSHAQRSLVYSQISLVAIESNLFCYLAVQNSFSINGCMIKPLFYNYSRRATERETKHMWNWILLWNDKNASEVFFLLYPACCTPTATGIQWVVEMHDPPAPSLYHGIRLTH